MNHSELSPTEQLADPVQMGELGVLGDIALSTSWESDEEVSLYAREAVLIASVLELDHDYTTAFKSLFDPSRPGDLTKEMKVAVDVLYNRLLSMSSLSGDILNDIGDSNDRGRATFRRLLGMFHNDEGPLRKDPECLSKQLAGLRPKERKERENFFTEYTSSVREVLGDYQRSIVGNHIQHADARTISESTDSQSFEELEQDSAVKFVAVRLGYRSWADEAESMSAFVNKSLERFSSWLEDQNQKDSDGVSRQLRFGGYLELIRAYLESDSDTLSTPFLWKFKYPNLPLKNPTQAPIDIDAVLRVISSAVNISSESGSDVAKATKINGRRKRIVNEPARRNNNWRDKAECIGMDVKTFIPDMEEDEDTEVATRKLEGGEIEEEQELEEEVVVLDIEDYEEYHPTLAQKIKLAKAVCNGCGVRKECLAYALENGNVGVWGGSYLTQIHRPRS